jgi:YbgC/YbaW family acyl-CoA thioester hydrolase
VGTTLDASAPEPSIGENACYTRRPVAARQRLIDQDLIPDESEAGGLVPKHFTKAFQVGWSEIDANGQVGISNYFQYVVETAWAWGAANGLGLAESESLGLAWVMHETEISILRPLRSGDEFDLTIWLAEWRRVRGTRCFELRLKHGGEVVAQGVQEIVVLDSRSLRPKAAPEHLIANLRMENPRIIPRGNLPKPRITPAGAFASQRAVEWRDLDWQEHVNNSTYPAYAEEAAVQALTALGWSPARWKAEGYAMANRRVHVQHPSSATWGERLNVTTSLIELKPTGGTWYVEIQRQPDGAPIARCVLEWSTTDRLTGHGKQIPESLYRALQGRLVAADDPTD